MSFTGQDSLTGFALQLSDLLWLNEIPLRGDPYLLYHAGTANSGFSFGAIQWDIPNYSPLSGYGLKTAQAIFEDILQGALANGQRIIDESTFTNITKLENV